MKISVLGDSISTYSGYNPKGYAVYYDENYQAQTHLTDVSLTWWHRVISHLGGILCVNDSYSGSKVSGGRFPSGSSLERIGNLGDPDVILVYLGMNDYGYAIPVKAPSGHNNPLGLSFFAPAYESMLEGLKSTYPKAQIICGTLMMTRMKEYDGWGFPTHYHGNSFDDYNTAIRRACEKYDCQVADLVALGIRYQSLDGTHPDVVGHEEIAGAWIQCLQEG